MSATSFDFMTPKGISYISIPTILSGCNSSATKRYLEDKIILPWPVLKAWSIPSIPFIIPPVGKSGPLTISRNSSNFVVGFLINLMVASIISFKLWGGISVAKPAAIPLAPLISKLGI